ncbi:MAG: archaetidylinositol phosphate synthase [Desulfurobacteriaceae bacterium]
MVSSTRLKNKVQEVLEPLVKELKVSPNVITVLGFIFSLLSGVFIGIESLNVGILFFVLSGLCDMLDGIVARINGKTTKFGAFLDSFLDRYADFFPLMGLAVLGFYKQDFVLFFFSLLSIVGSFSTSYARARAEGLGLDCKVGILERPERFFLILFGLVSGLLHYTLFILAILSNITAFQRLLYVWGKLKE